ncbi:MAG: hypothetical protein HQL52_11285 [Magnetococcales bacterium]|nr:hypothetical protein [Magnetococcales bacterium]
MLSISRAGLQRLYGELAYQRAGAAVVEPDLGPGEDPSPRMRGREEFAGKQESGDFQAIFMKALEEGEK